MLDQNRDAGSTASTPILVGDRLLVANVGDSRVVISKGGKVIEDAGGFVMWAGTWRVGGVLAVSREFGDKLLSSMSWLTQRFKRSLGSCSSS
ncbi:putative protein-serine/threonine phosphatase [Helianthus annuus]|nr:putative protein-serine/threonine phosphatase [Helianthus annuus]